MKEGQISYAFYLLVFTTHVTNFVNVALIHYFIPSSSSGLLHAISISPFVIQVSCLYVPATAIFCCYLFHYVWVLVRIIYLTLCFIKVTFLNFLSLPITVLKFFFLKKFLLFLVNYYPYYYSSYKAVQIPSLYNKKSSRTRQKRLRQKTSILVNYNGL